ncbi:hypothetical protein [Aquisalimonas asiatica]|uniref:Cytoplasmic protein n=1 Tax=Aquisalimonas asiatica TaxID=406100 RepID=A0A1H8RRP4_9GAMM|nr:hypothetical protein [Aquisalimonas asiatica]SEO68623.1 hypothetical protein SAMN04488052_102181 [Aquisalimonas asiatica]
MSEADQMPDMSLDTSALVQEETFTDGRVGAIRRMTPVNTDGSRDESRPVTYSGQSQVMTQGGALPLSFDIEADSLEDAIAKFPDAANQALEDMIRRIEEMQREQATSIVTPGQGGGMGGGMGGGGSQGMPGGGIQFR